MSEPKPLVIYSKSRVMMDWKCPRSRYWGYEYGGKGLVGTGIQLELYLGQALHDGLAAIASGVGIDETCKAANTQVLNQLLKETTGEVGEINFAHEQACLVEGMLRGYYKQVWLGYLTKQYPTIVNIEKEMVYNHDGLTFMAKPDLVVRDSDGALWYVEFKSTSTKNEKWINSWATAIQLHSTVKAIESLLDEKVVGVQVVGLYKGYAAYNKQTSSFCYGYVRQGNPPFSETQTLYEFRAGFKKSPVWEMDGGIKKWVDGMPSDLLAAQFPLPPPIFINEDLIDKFFKQRSFREHEIKLALQLMRDDLNDGGDEILEVAFPQRFDQCYPAWGRPCVYRQLCHGHVEDPLEVGFEWKSQEHLKGWELS